MTNLKERGYNCNRIHTTTLGIIRIKKNIGLETIGIVD
jgi:hypothetical protein